MKTQKKKRKISRRGFLKAGAATATVSAIQPISLLETFDSLPAKKTSHWSQKQEVAVIGGGAFGGWTALNLLRRGVNVTLLDAWGPGNSRASSGGETRVLRAIYGADEIYVKMAARSFQLWRQAEKQWRQELYKRTGALWMFQKEDDFVRSSLPLLSKVGLAVEELTLTQAARRFPQVNFDGVRTVFLEDEAGYISARRSCKLVLDTFIAEGGHYRQLAVQPGAVNNGRLTSLALSDGSQLSVDAYVFACGSWLGKIFPAALGNIIKPTRQSVYYFGAPAGDQNFISEKLPVWVDFGGRIFYGIPGDGRRGFKMADDTRGEDIDPTSDERKPDHEGFELARNFVEFRFPGLKGAPLLEARACVYEHSPDHHFIIDTHPGADNLWLVGGGSGHGFKHGPAVGEMVAAMVVGDKKPEPFFALSRFS